MIYIQTWNNILNVKPVKLVKLIYCCTKEKCLLSPSFPLPLSFLPPPPPSLSPSFWVPCPVQRGSGQHTALAWHSLSKSGTEHHLDSLHRVNPYSWHCYLLSSLLSHTAVQRWSQTYLSTVQDVINIQVKHSTFGYLQVTFDHFHNIIFKNQSWH